MTRPLGEVRSISVLDAARDEMFAHMNHDLPNECVGLILDDGTVVRLINQARSPDRFSVSTHQLEIPARLYPNRGLIGIYHSHPKGVTNPSPIDVEFMAQCPSTMLFPIVTEREITTWTLSPLGYSLYDRMFLLD